VIALNKDDGLFTNLRLRNVAYPGRLRDEADCAGWLAFQLWRIVADARLRVSKGMRALTLSTRTMPTKSAR
jgi:hypothetical protein